MSKRDLLSVLKRVFSGGEVLTADLQERFFSTLPSELINLYGPTEACIDAAYWICDRNSKEQCIPIGRPINNAKLFILDEQLQPVPIGVSGELYIGGYGLAKGYLNRPDLTAERFIFSDALGMRLYKTGDIARYLPGGEIVFVGRKDNQVKLRFALSWKR
ncbi:AMP-binding protein [Paenactinomyces guangxiensis]|uniref:AMP-binding protein n=1 Tax=Paenactinomyces guangxiensis TaxID=1490290 RepID=UPI00215D721D|nr:AMP-binding protein [Paenactinomyces guangxiensis]